MEIKHRAHSGDAIFWSSREWCAFFESNSYTRQVPWNEPPALTLNERIAFSASIQTFQLGESSEGKRLLQAAEIQSEQTGDLYLAEAIRLFIGEEQRHASMLGRFLRNESIPLLKQQWTDSMFRFLRRRWNLELCVAVLMTAELVARVYYRALRDATDSPSLQSICRHLLRDEMHHLAFHAGILGDLRGNRPEWMNAIWDAVYSTFHQTTLVVVWHGHKNVFRAGGFPFRRYRKASKLHLNRALQMIRSRKKLASTHQAMPTPATAR
jgi:hypothetical protein